MLAKLTAFVISLLPIDTKAPTWPLSGLHEELNGIASIESQLGKYVNHKAHPLGNFHTAFGSLGLKPSTAHWMYMRTPKLQRQFPGLKDEYIFLREFWSNANLYTRCANAHWEFLRTSTPTLVRAVYAWRWGLTASNNTPDAEIAKSTYVNQYVELTAQ